MSKKNSPEEGNLLISTPIMELVDYPTITNKRKGFYELTIADYIRIKGAGFKELIRNLTDIYFTLESINDFTITTITSQLTNDLLDLMKNCASKDRDPEYNVVSDGIGIFGYTFCDPTAAEDGSCSVKFTLWIGNPDTDKYVSYTVRMKWIGIDFNNVCAAVGNALKLVQSFFVDTRSVVRNVKYSVEMYFAQPSTSGVPVFGTGYAGFPCPYRPNLPPPAPVQSPDDFEQPEDDDDNN